MKPNRTALFSILLALFFILAAAHGYAQSIAGDTVCGASAPCQLSDLTKIGRSFLAMAMYLGGAIFIIFASFVIIKAVRARMAGNTNAIKDAGNYIFQGLIGFALVFLIGGGLLAVALKTFGVRPEFLKLLELFSSGFFNHAYAEELLPNPYSSNSAYDIIIGGASLIMRFFIYPALIALIVWSGLKFVISQGNPNGLKEAKAWLWWSIIAVIIVFSLQGFLLAFQATVQKIVPIQQNTTQNQTATQQNTSTGEATIKQGEPAPGAYGSACTIGGYNGRIGTDGKCYAGGFRP
jgi:hypothetical protein